MLRCVKNRRVSEKNRREAKTLAEKYGFRQTLLALAETQKDPS